MIRNRYFKQTLGVPAEILIAQGFDLTAAETPAVGATQATATFTSTVAGSPTAGDQQVYTVGAHEFHYEVQSADTTAALYGTALLAYLNAEAYSVANSIVWTKSGTTTLVVTATFPAGTAPNGTVVAVKAGSTNAGPTFSGMSSTNVSGGTNAIADQQATYKGFVTTALAGTLGVYWDDTNTAVNPGELSLPANSARSYFYAVKQADSVNSVKRSTPIPLSGRTLAQCPYTAGTLPVWTVAYAGGTYTNGQILHIKISDTTATQLPYPQWDYEAVITGSSSDAALAAIVILINAETSEPIVTATSSTSTITITGADNHRTFKVTAYLETVTGATTDASAIVITNTVKGVEERGTVADILELDKYMQVNGGGINYAPEGQNVSEWQAWYTNAVTGTTYGVLIVKSERYEQGETRSYHKKMYTFIALPTASLATLAAY